MKYYIKLFSKTALALSLIFLFIGGCGSKKETVPEAKPTLAQETAKPEVKKTYKIKSAIIYYDAELMGMVQTQTFYIDNFGEKEARYSLMKIEMMGQKVETEDVEINADGFVTKFDMKKKTGTKRKSFGSISGAQSGVPDASSFSKDMMEKYKFKELGEKEILGKKCKGYTMVFNEMKVEAWSWENVPILMNMLDKNGKQFITIKATKIETDVAVPADKFTVPTGVVIKDM